VKKLIELSALKLCLIEASKIRAVTNSKVIGNELLNSVLLSMSRSTQINLKTMQGERFAIGEFVFDLFLTSYALKFIQIKNGEPIDSVSLSRNPVKHIDKILAKQNGVVLEGKGYIYLVSDGKNTKIGATTYNPTKRLNELQVGNAKKLTLIGSYQVERRIATESLLHSAYGSKNIRGEWFSLSGQDIVGILSNRMQSSVNSEYQVLTSKDANRISLSIDSLFHEKAKQMKVSLERLDKKLRLCDKYAMFLQKNKEAPYELLDLVLAHAQGN